MTKMRKFLSLLMATLMGASLVVMSACNDKTSSDETSGNVDSSADVCEHEYSEDFVCIQEPTCLEVGKKAITCVNCGEIKGNTADITARGHDYGDTGVCIRCSIPATIPEADPSATYIDPTDSSSGIVGDGTEYNRYGLSVDGYYTIELGRSGKMWVEFAFPTAGQYALYSVENNGISAMRYDASAQYIPIDKDGNYIGFECGSLSGGNIVSTVNCSPIYWNDSIRATFRLFGEKGATAKIHIVKIDDAAWQPGYVRKDVLAEQIDGTAPEGPEGAMPTVVPYDTEYFYDYNEETDTGYYRMGTPENPGEIIYVAITSTPERMLLDKSFSVIQYEGDNLTLGNGKTADGDYLLLQYAPFIMSNSEYGGTSNSYELYVNSDGMYPVNQELFEFLNLYVKNTKPMDIPDSIWEDEEEREHSAWLAACYYYDVLPLGSKLNPYKVSDDSFEVTTKEYDYVYYNITYTNEADYNSYVSYVDVICEDENALLYIGNQSYTAPFKVRIETNYSKGAELKFASVDGSVVTYSVTLRNAIEGVVSEYPITLTPDANGDVQLNFTKVHMLDGSISYECYYEYTATKTGQLTFSTDAKDIYMLASNVTVDENTSSSTSSTQPTNTDTYLDDNGEATMNVTVGDVISIYISSKNADSIVFNIQE